MILVVIHRNFEIFRRHTEKNAKFDTNPPIFTYILAIEGELENWCTNLSIFSIKFSLLVTKNSYSDLPLLCRMAPIESR